MAQWVKVPLATIVTADCNKKARNNGQCLSEAEKRKTKLQTHSVINSAPCERSFHERAAAGGHIEDRLNGPVIQKSLPKCNWLWLVPKNGTSSPWRSFHSAGGGAGLWTVDWNRMFFFPSRLKRISETDRELTPEYVPWNVDSSPQAVKCSFLLALILARWTGHLTAMVSTLNTA